MTTHLRKLRATKVPNVYSLVSQNTRLYRTKSALKTQKSETCSLDQPKRIPRVQKKAAQAALLDYFRFTRNLSFLDAQNMSLNSPIFLRKLLKRVFASDYDDGDIRMSILRYLRYNPDNELEPFFESLGLKPAQYSPLLPWDSVFLSDAGPLLGTYHELCSFGFSHRSIGKIFLEATEVVYSGVEILASTLRAYDKLGLGKSTLVKFVACSPRLLLGNGVNVDFIAALEILKSLGFEMGWIEGSLEEGNSYNWSHMLEIFGLLSKIGLSKEQTVETLKNHPTILFEDSGQSTVLLLGFLLKFGCETDEVCSLLVQFPRIKVGNFVSNLKRCVSVLNELEMEPLLMGGLIRSRALLIGSCTLKSARTIMNILHAGQKKVCSYILENPEELKKLVLGEVKSMPTLCDDHSLSKALKKEFLLGLGYVEGSDEMNKAQKLIVGKGSELQERFDLIVSYGLDREVVSEMVKASPRILNNSKSVIEQKIDILVVDFGYPISYLSIFPGYLYYSVDRIRLRLSMCEWLKNQGLGKPSLVLSTAIVNSEKEFVRRFVNRYLGAIEAWQDLKDNICSKQTTT